MNKKHRHNIIKFFNSTLKRDIFILSVITFIAWYSFLEILFSPIILIFIFRIYIGLILHIGRKNVIVLYNKNKKNFKHVFNDLNNKHSFLFKKIIDITNNSFLDTQLSYEKNQKEGLFFLITATVFLTIAILNSIWFIIISLLFLYLSYYYLINNNENNLVLYPEINIFIYSTERESKNIIEHKNNLSKDNVKNKSLSFIEIYEELIYVYNKSNIYIDKSIKVILHINRK